MHRVTLSAGLQSDCSPFSFVLWWADREVGKLVFMFWRVGTLQVIVETGINEAWFLSRKHSSWADSRFCTMLSLFECNLS